MRVKTRLMLLVGLCVAFLLINIFALPFSSLSSYSAIWAMAYNDKNDDKQDDTAPVITDFINDATPDQLTTSVLLPAEMVQSFETAFPPPAGSTFGLLIYTSGFSNKTIKLSSVGIDCAKVTAYRVTELGELVPWSLGCDADGNLVIPGTGLPGHVILYVGDGTTPAAGVNGDV